MVTNRQERVMRRQAALLRLAALDHSDPDESFRLATELDGRILKVERVSLWLLSADRSQLACRSLFRLTEGAHGPEERLATRTCPRYLRALLQGHPFAVNDVRKDPRVDEFLERYRILGIGAALEAPVFHRGAVAGVVRHEHRGGPRTWTEEELSFAATIARLVGTALEAGERRRAEQALRDERNFATTMLDAAASIFVVLDERGRIVRSNRALERLLGHAPDDVQGRSFSDRFFRPDDGPAVEQVLDRLRAGGPPEEQEDSWVAGDETTRRIAWTAGALPAPSGIRHFLVTGVDVTVRKSLEDQIIHDAFHDALTGLANRALFMDRLGQRFRSAQRRRSRPFAVLVLDLDRFKLVNDGLGHVAGDRLLVEAARRLLEAVRPADTVARLGGDEFGVLLPDVGEGADAAAVARRIQDRLLEPFSLGPQEVFVTASIGIAVSQGEGSPEELVRDADTAADRAKTRGGARHQLFDPEMHARAVALLRMESELRRAVERGEFELRYQPVVSLADRRIRGFEALVRWCHPERGMVPPGEFISMSEDTGLVVPIDRWVLRTAARQLRRWHDRFPASDLCVSVNLSGRHFAHPDLADHVRHTLAEAKVRPGSIALELTESVLMDASDEVTALLRRLRETGVRLYLDDFGTGYSSLGYLHRFPIDSLKIDRSFISSIRPGGEGGEIVRTIVSLARNLRMGVIAEGVETDDQHRALRELECELAQGYAFGRPLSCDEATTLLVASS